MITVFYHPDAGIPPSTGTAITLAEDSVASQACTDYNNGNVNTYYRNGTSFNNATILAFNPSLTVLAPPGYYSDGTLYRYWEGSVFADDYGSCF